MRNKVRFLMIAVAVLTICSGCANRNCSICLLKKVAIEEINNTDQLLKAAAVEQINDDLEKDQDIILTTISWDNTTLSFLSEEVEIEERRVILCGVDGQLGGEWPSIDWALPMKADYITVYLPMGADCSVCIDGECALFPREVE